MTSPTRWAWVWVNSGSWWWTADEQMMNREAWCSAIHGVSRSRTLLNDWTELNWSSESSQLYWQYICWISNAGFAIHCIFSSFQSFSLVQLFATPGTAACQASLSITNSWSLLKHMSIKSAMPSDHLIFCLPLLLLPSVFPNIRMFSNKSVLHLRKSEYWSFTFSVSPSNEYSGLISFRMDWLDILAVQGTLKSLLQHHSSKVSILWRSAFFIVLTLISIHDYWRNQSFHWTDHCQQSNVSAF